MCLPLLFLPLPPLRWLRLLLFGPLLSPLPLLLLLLAILRSVSASCSAPAWRLLLRLLLVLLLLLAPLGPEAPLPPETSRLQYCR